jgi:hypothetical protein
VGAAHAHYAAHRQWRSGASGSVTPISVWMFTDPALAPLAPTVEKPHVGNPNPSSAPTTSQLREAAQREDNIPGPPAAQVDFNYDAAAGMPAMERPWTHGGQYPAIQSWAGWGQAGSRERYYALNRNAGGSVRASFNAATPSSGFGASRSAVPRSSVLLCLSHPLRRFRGASLADHGH